jgi:hypothetical protein
VVVAFRGLKKRRKDMEGMEFSKEFVERLSRILFQQEIDNGFFAENLPKHHFSNRRDTDFDRLK